MTTIVSQANLAADRQLHQAEGKLAAPTVKIPPSEQRLAAVVQAALMIEIEIAVGADGNAHERLERVGQMPCIKSQDGHADHCTTCNGCHSDMPLCCISVSIPTLVGKPSKMNSEVSWTLPAS